MNTTKPIVKVAWVFESQSQAGFLNAKFLGYIQEMVGNDIEIIHRFITKPSNDYKEADVEVWFTDIPPEAPPPGKEDFIYRESASLAFNPRNIARGIRIKADPSLLLNELLCGMSTKERRKLFMEQENDTVDLIGY